LAAPRRAGEGAVVADVPAERGERDEHLRRVGHEHAVPRLPQPPRLGAELVQGRMEQGASVHGVSLRTGCRSARGSDRVASSQMAPQFGVNVVTSAGDGADPVRDAKRAEELGFDFVSSSDHPGAASPSYETWTMLTWIAA